MLFLILFSFLFACAPVQAAKFTGFVVPKAVTQLIKCLNEVQAQQSASANQETIFLNNEVIVPEELAQSFDNSEVAAMQTISENPQDLVVMQTDLQNDAQDLNVLQQVDVESTLKKTQDLVLPEVVQSAVKKLKPQVVQVEQKDEYVAPNVSKNLLTIDFKSIAVDSTYVLEQVLLLNKWVMGQAYQDAQKKFLPILNDACQLVNQFSALSQDQHKLYEQKAHDLMNNMLQDIRASEEESKSLGFVARNVAQKQANRIKNNLTNLIRSVPNCHAKSIQLVEGLKAADISVMQKTLSEIREQKLATKCLKDVVLSLTNSK